MEKRRRSRPGADDFPRPIATVDVALFTLSEGALAVGLLPRVAEPHAGRRALPGGFIRVDQDADATATARRVLADKCGVKVPYLEQLYTFSGRKRDPRGWSLSVAYYALVPAETSARHASAGLSWHPVDALPRLPFDHRAIVTRGVERLRGKSTYSSLPAYLLPELFTFAELHEVYERVIGVRLDMASFRRKIQDQGIIVPEEGHQRTGAHRPAQLFRLNRAARTEFERKI